MVNYRSKTVALVLCFFFGMLGAHWFYLGRWAWGRLYAAVFLLAWPAALVITTAIPVPAIGACSLVFAWGAETVLAFCVLYDLVCLLMIHPRQFDQAFNG